MRSGVAALVVLLAAACACEAAAGARRPVVRVRISAATHTPRANAPWPVTIRVTGSDNKPLKAKLTMRVLLGAIEVGKVEDGRVYRIIGVWREPKGEEITWPPASRGQPLTFQAVVTALGRTVRKNWWIKVR
jgi:hypothetical protein